MERKDLALAPVLEAALIFVVALAGWLVHKPLLFASLGPTAYEQVETPKRKSGRPYNVIVGHLIAVLAGFAALWICRAWSAPGVSSGTVPLPRAEAAAVSAFLTVLGTLVARASQPAAISTTLLISLGLLQTWQDGLIIMGGVVLLTIVGEPLRRWRARDPMAD
ncbi:MAG TPA: HPP family protein [Terracidiphilus sp.]|jgi:hypothetical protein